MALMNPVVYRNCPVASVARPPKKNVPGEPTGVPGTRLRAPPAATLNDVTEFCWFDANKNFSSRLRSIASTPFPGGVKGELGICASEPVALMLKTLIRGKPELLSSNKRLLAQL